MTVIVILVFLSVLGLSLVTLLLSRVSTANLELDRLQALYLAEAGIAKSVHELKYDKDFDANGIGNVAVTALAGGTFKASHDFQLSSITSVGEVNGIRRRIQIQYSTL